MSKEKKIKKKPVLDKISIIISVISVFLSAAALRVSIVSQHRDDLQSIPKFSLTIERTGEDSIENLNRKYILYNDGGQVKNPTIIPVMQLELSCLNYVEGEFQKEGTVLIEFTDYFTDDYFYDPDESSFVIEETNANEIYNLMHGMNKYLMEENMFINLYSIKYYFQISYEDYKGNRTEKIYCPKNNHAQISFTETYHYKHDRDNILEETDSIREANMKKSLDDEKYIPPVDLNVSSDSEDRFQKEKEQKREIDVSNSIKVYLKENLEELENSMREIKSFVHKKEYYKITNKKSDREIIDGREHVLGFMEQ